MAGLVLHAGSSGLFHTLLDTALSVGLGVVAVAAYLLVLRYFTGSSGRGTR